MHFGLDVDETAESFIQVVDFIKVFLEGEELTSLDFDDGTARFWSSVWNEMVDLWEVVVIVPQLVLGCLLVIQRDGEGNGLSHDIGIRRVASHIGRIDDRGWSGSRTEVTCCLPVGEISEVFSPDYNTSVAVLWSVSWVEGNDPRRLVVSVRDAMCGVVEVSRE